MCVTGKKNSPRIFYPPRFIRLVSRSSVSSRRPVPVPRLFLDFVSFPVPHLVFLLRSVSLLLSRRLIPVPRLFPDSASFPSRRLIPVPPSCSHPHLTFRRYFFGRHSSRRSSSDVTNPQCKSFS